jgi:hypothetical protein
MSGLSRRRQSVSLRSSRTLTVSGPRRSLPLPGGADTACTTPGRWEEFDRPDAARAFRVIRPDGLQGEHWFELGSAEGATVLRHTLEGCAAGKYEAIWRERIEPLHDLILEALLDNVEAAAAADRTDTDY